MHSGRFVFSQVMDHLPMKIFRRCVQRYQGNRHIQSEGAHHRRREHTALAV